MSTISAVIPTWCERNSIAACVASAREIADEVIVADANSHDGTAALAAGCGARVVVCDKGRGPQLHAGARAARGDVLLFLHADAELPPAARAAIFECLADPEVLGGNFLLEFTGPSWYAPWFSRANDLRRRLFRVYYGDSAIFVRRSVYGALGGFRAYPIFEDHEFVQRLERHGRTAYVREVCVRVSSRRYEQAPLRTLLSWAVLHGLYSFAGVPPERLAQWYADIRASAGALR